MLAAVLKISTLEVFLLLTCLLGDYLVTLPVAKQHMMGVLVDNVTHGIIGGISWAILTIPEIGADHSFTDCAVCMVLSMMVDVDHFLAAKSIHLKDALSLKNRPPFHSTTLAISVIILLAIYATISKIRYARTVTMLFTVAVLSHHVRDGTRRGLWLSPFGSTRPIPKVAYIGIIMTLPVVFSPIYYMWRDSMLKTIIADSVV